MKKIDDFCEMIESKIKTATVSKTYNVHVRGTIAIILLLDGYDQRTN